MNKIISVTAFYCLFTSTLYSQEKNFIDQPYIEVTGSADSLVTPNQIYIKIIISEKDTKDKIPLELLESKMLDAFKLLSINTEKDLTTSDMLSNYRYYLIKKRDISKSKEYILMVRDAAKASEVFIKLEELDISNTSVERVNHTDLESIQNICRIKAIINAKTKATAMTNAIGQTIGNAIHIVDDRSKTYTTELNGRVQGIVVTGYSSMNNKAKYEPPKMDFEKINVTAAIQAKFTLKNN